MGTPIADGSPLREQCHVIAALAVGPITIRLSTLWFYARDNPPRAKRSFCVYSDKTDRLQ
jgi:hypothetical protein